MKRRSRRRGRRCFYRFMMYGGPDGELGASLRYLSQRYSMPYRNVAGILTDVGTEELAHLEMISAMVYQLTRNLTVEQIKEQGFAPYFVDHTTGVYPVAASGPSFTCDYFQSKGDPLPWRMYPFSPGVILIRPAGRCAGGRCFLSWTCPFVR